MRFKDNKRLFGILLLGLLALLSARQPSAGESKGSVMPGATSKDFVVKLPPSKIQKVTITGEVIEVWCYLSQTMGPGKGETHKACATACGNGGIPLGILEDKTGQVFVAAKSKKPYQGCFEMLLPYVAQKVTVQGYVARGGGCQVLRIESVAPAK